MLVARKLQLVLARFGQRCRCLSSTLVLQLLLLGSSWIHFESKLEQQQRKKERFETCLAYSPPAAAGFSFVLSVLVPGTWNTQSRASSQMEIAPLGNAKQMLSDPKQDVTPFWVTLSLKDLATLEENDSSRFSEEILEQRNHRYNLQAESLPIWKLRIVVYLSTYHIFNLHYRGSKKGCFVGTLNEVALWNFLAANETILHAEFYIEKFSWFLRDQVVTSLKCGCFVVHKNGCFVELEYPKETTFYPRQILCDQVTKCEKGCFVVHESGCFVELHNRFDAI